jgi:hypothetical protein
MKVKIFSGFWSQKDCENKSDYLFIFGDNDMGFGKGGQAIIRDYHNAVGIPTKKYPSFKNDSFYTDKELEINKHKITTAVDSILGTLRNNSNTYRGIFLPENGLGTGLAKLDKRAPKTFAFLNKEIERLKSEVSGIL